MLKLLQWLPFFSNLRKHPECLKPTSALKKKKKKFKKTTLGSSRCYYKTNRES